MSPLQTGLLDLLVSVSPVTFWDFLYSSLFHVTAMMMPWHGINFYVTKHLLVFYSPFLPPAGKCQEGRNFRTSFPWLVEGGTMCNVFSVPDLTPCLLPPTNSHNSADDNVNHWSWTYIREDLWTTMSLSHTTLGFDPGFTTCLLSMCLKSLDVSLLLYKTEWYFSGYKDSSLFMWGA